jgi:hypothetical protein
MTRNINADRSQTAAMIVLSGLGPVGALIPMDWQITSFVAIWPISTVVTFHFVSLHDLIVCKHMLTVTAHAPGAEPRSHAVHFLSER